MRGFQVLAQFVILPLTVFGLVGAFLMSDPILLAVCIILLTVLIFLGALRANLRLKKKGFLIAREGRDCICYQEMTAAGVRKLTIPGELMVGAPHVVYVPTDTDWELTMPAWARGRKSEIVSRVKSELGTKRYEFVEKTA